MNKPFSQASENNKHPILNIIKNVFTNTKTVLEIGSGTGQHAVFFGQHLSHLTWQTSDLAINHQAINLWLDESDLDNLEPPVCIDLNEVWTEVKGIDFDAVYTANTLHIIRWSLVVKFFEGIKQNLASKGLVCIYGPFKYQGEFTSASNADFDLWLKDRDKESGIRDMEAILRLANSADLNLLEDHEMPANNRLLVFSKT